MEPIEEALNKLTGMAHGSAQLEVARALWDRTRQEAEPALKFKVLCEVLKAVIFSGDTALFLALFPQFSALKKEHPASINLPDYVWRLKWLIGNLVDFPEIPAQRIRQAEEQYAAALAEAGGAPRTAIYLRWRNAYNEGRMKDARALLPAFINMRRDVHSDCHACEVNSLAYSALWMDDDYESAREIAEPILKGTLRCASIPHITHANLVFPAWRAGGPEADVYHQKGYPLIRGNMNFLGKVGSHLLYLTGIRNADRLLRLLRAHLSWLDHNTNPSDHLHFLLGAALGCRMLAQTGQRKRPLLLPLPQKLRQAWGEEARPAAELGDLFLKETQVLAEAFDRRNGNDTYSRMVTQCMVQTQV